MLELNTYNIYNYKYIHKTQHVMYKNNNNDTATKQTYLQEENDTKIN